ncbi:uncharacterized protein RCC_02269 [Ramularia collo-cygni]|uniref:Uncharacterized protein n=1 Tax=Ramularia collo-cygni TaxID=112498 RepID=A0A2D3UYY9_9PEZI|nr:uncharacterized protein RCC_02269 [Ramularia collo-cygni]CZT16426.1 uncharacterized protein RCC_02269 [Ramularia collo-cygni]
MSNQKPIPGRRSAGKHNSGLQPELDQKDALIKSLQDEIAVKDDTIAQQIVSLSVKSEQVKETAANLRSTIKTLSSVENAADNIAGQAITDTLRATHASLTSAAEALQQSITTLDARLQTSKAEHENQLAEMRQAHQDVLDLFRTDNQQRREAHLDLLAAVSDGLKAGMSPLAEREEFLAKLMKTMNLYEEALLM